MYSVGTVQEKLPLHKKKKKGIDQKEKKKGLKN